MECVQKGDASAVRDLLDDYGHLIDLDETDATGNVTSASLAASCFPQLSAFCYFTTLLQLMGAVVCRSRPTVPGGGWRVPPGQTLILPGGQPAAGTTLQTAGHRGRHDRILAAADRCLEGISLHIH